MSARALNWAFDQEPKTTSQKLVLIALADRADEHGVCWPSVEWITKKCAPMNPETARRVLRELAQQGLVEKVRRLIRKDGTFSTWLLRLPVDHRALMPAGEYEWEDAQPPGTGDHDHRALVTEPPGTGARADSRTEPKSEKNPDGFSLLVEQWLDHAPPLIKHDAATLNANAALKKLARSRISTYGVEAIAAAIRNYAAVLDSPEHFLTKRWSLHEFLAQRNALPKLLDEAEPLTNMRRFASGRDRGLTTDDTVAHFNRRNAERSQTREPLALPAPDLDRAA